MEVAEFGIVELVVTTGAATAVVGEVVDADSVVVGRRRGDGSGRVVEVIDEPPLTVVEVASR